MHDDLTLEKIRVNDRLKTMEDAVGKLSIDMAKFLTYLETNKTLYESSMGEIKRIVQRHDKELFGNGHEGLMVKVDRLVTAEEGRRTHFLAVWSAIVLMALQAVMGWIKGNLGR